jgi:hypothetical protein
MTESSKKTQTLDLYPPTKNEAVNFFYCNQNSFRLKYDNEKKKKVAVKGTAKDIMIIAAGKEADTTTHQVFISYASENINSITSDRQVADQIYSALESQGIRCWIAHRNILPGD